MHIPIPVLKPNMYQLHPSEELTPLCCPRSVVSAERNIILYRHRGRRPAPTSSYLTLFSSCLFCFLGIKASCTPSNKLAANRCILFLADCPSQGTYYTPYPKGIYEEDQVKASIIWIFICVLEELCLSLPVQLEQPRGFQSRMGRCSVWYKQSPLSILSLCFPRDEKLCTPFPYTLKTQREVRRQNPSTITEAGGSSCLPDSKMGQVPLLTLRERDTLKPWHWAISQEKT